MGTDSTECGYARNCFDFKTGVFNQTIYIHIRTVEHWIAQSKEYYILTGFQIAADDFFGFLPTFSLRIVIKHHWEHNRHDFRMFLDIRFSNVERYGTVFLFGFWRNNNIRFAYNTSCFDSH